MVSSTLILFTSLLSLANARPQLPFFPTGPLNLVGTQDRVSSRPGATKKAFIYGPFTLKGKDEWKMPGSMDPKGSSFVHVLSKAPCPEGDCTVLTSHWSLAYAGEDGGVPAQLKEATPADDVYIHHMLSFDTVKTPNTFVSGECGALGGKDIGRMGAYFGDRGEDSGNDPTVFAPPGEVQSGYHMKANANLLVQMDLVNYSNDSKKLFLVLETESVPGAVGKDAGAILRSVTGCGVREPKISESGSAWTKGGEMNVDYDTTITWSRGHLHSGGTRMLLMINGKVACESLPTYNTEGTIVAMSLCPPNIKVKKGDKLSVSSEYNLMEHPLRKATDGHGKAHSTSGATDVMGMFMITFERQEMPAAST